MKKQPQIPEKYLAMAAEIKKVKPEKIKVPLRLNDHTSCFDVKRLLESCVCTMLNPKTDNEIRELQYDQLQEFLNVLPKQKNKKVESCPTLL